MKSCGVIFLITVVYLSQLKKIQADLQDPLASVPTIQTPVGPDREGPACQMCCQDGPAAVPAVQGDPGHVGPSGLPGLPGEKGDLGLQGVKGAAGAHGLPGEIGEIGLRGKPGIGPKGGWGSKGLPGFDGPKGLSGDRGQRGLSKKGEPGFSGVEGDQGILGEPGITGPKGETGEYPKVSFTLRRKAPFSSTSDTTRLSFDEVVEASPDATVVNLEMGMFTCPRHGTYVFMFSVLKSIDIEQPLRVHLYKNEEDIVSAQTTATAENYHPIGGSATLDLRRGDTVFLNFYGSVRDVTDTTEYTSFSGFLLY